MGDRGADPLTPSLLLLLACAPPPTADVSVVLPVAQHATAAHLGEHTWPVGHGVGCVWRGDPARALAAGTAVPAVVEVRMDGVWVEGAEVDPLRGGAPVDRDRGPLPGLAAHLDQRLGEVAALEGRCGPGPGALLVAADHRVPLRTWLRVEAAARSAGAARLLLVVDDLEPQAGGDDRPSVQGPARTEDDTVGEVAADLDTLAGRGAVGGVVVAPVDAPPFRPAAVPAPRRVGPVVSVLEVPPTTTTPAAPADLVSDPLHAGVDCVVLRPALGSHAADLGVRPMRHQVLPVRRGALPDDVLVVEPGGQLTLDHDLVSPQPGLVPGLEGVVLDGRTVRVPAELEGAALGVEVQGEEGVELQLVAVGELGAHNLAAWADFAPYRDDMGVDAELVRWHCPECEVDRVEVELLGLVVDDLDHDGRGEALLSTRVRGYDADGTLVGEASELGIRWPRGRRTVVPLGADPYLLPELLVVPPALNRGRPMVVESAAAPELRAWDLGGVARATSRAMGREGELMCLRPGEGSRAAEVVRVRH